MPSPHDPAAVARALIWLAAQECRELDNFTLQKLLYYVQARSLSRLKRRMFSAPIKAYDHGPVVGAVWKQFRQSPGAAPIPSTEGHIALPETDLAFVAAVWDDYKHYSFDELYHKVHELEPLWKRHYKPMDENGGTSSTIPDQEIAEYFEGQLPEPIPKTWLANRRLPPRAWKDEGSPFPD